MDWNNWDLQGVITGEKMLFMAEEHQSFSGKPGEGSGGNSGVAGAVYEALLKQWGLLV